MALTQSIRWTNFRMKCRHTAIRCRGMFDPRFRRHVKELMNKADATRHRENIHLKAKFNEQKRELWAIEAEQAEVNSILDTSKNAALANTVNSLVVKHLSDAESEEIMLQFSPNIAHINRVQETLGATTEHIVESVDPWQKCRNLG